MFIFSTFFLQFSMSKVSIRAISNITWALGLSQYLSWHLCFSSLIRTWFDWARREHFHQSAYRRQKSWGIFILGIEQDKWIVRVSDAAEHLWFLPNRDRDYQRGAVFSIKSSSNSSFDSLYCIVSLRVLLYFIVRYSISWQLYLSTGGGQ